MMPTPEHYLSDATYAALKAKLADLIENPEQVAPDMDAASNVVEALGEIGNVWPESVLADQFRTI